MKTIAEELEDSVLAVTKDWAKQRKREERHAASRTYRWDRLIRSVRVSIKEAAWQVMEKAYLKASDGGQLPAKPRQIMYAARPDILARTDKETLDDAYFTQTLLPDYIEEHWGRCAGWDIIWDARGNFSEPHTGKEVPLGTLEVRQYTGERPEFGSVASIRYSDRFPTSGPQNRYDTVLFVEKEGFEPLFKAAAIAERFDVAMMSTKGMSTTAARLLLDRLTSKGVQQILVLHDFDVSGFSIFGTLGTDTRRYNFANHIPIIDIGIRLDDVEQMDLQSEPVTVSGDWHKRATTLQRHGATEEEIAFLQDHRVELNAMTSRQLIDFIEEKFAEHSVAKLIPDTATIEQHARGVIERQLAEQAIAKVTEEIAEKAKIAELPINLRERIEKIIEEQPELPWDAAVAKIVREEI